MNENIFYSHRRISLITTRIENIIVDSIHIYALIETTLFTMKSSYKFDHL